MRLHLNTADGSWAVDTDAANPTAFLQDAHVLTFGGCTFLPVTDAESGARGLINILALQAVEEQVGRADG